MKLQEATSCWDPKTKTITVSGQWTKWTLRFVMDYNSLKSLKGVKIVIPPFKKLTIADNLKPDKIYVADNAKLYTTSAALGDIHNDGLCIFRYKSNIKGVVNNGIIKTTGGTRINDVKNNRHLYIGSKSYMYNCYMNEASSLIVSNSYVVDCDACDTAVVDSGTGYFVGCKGKLKQYNISPGVTLPAYNAKTNKTRDQLEKDLRALVIHYCSQTCNRMGYTGPKSPTIKQEYNDIISLLADKNCPRLAGALARDIMESSKWPVATDNYLKVCIGDNRPIKLPY